MKDRLIEIIKQCACHYSPPCDGDCGLCNNVEMYDDQIEHIADAIIESDIIKCCHRQSEWISIDERLPEEGVRVLVWLKGDGSQYTSTDTDRLSLKKWVRWGRLVTHWMPLPEPPKGE